MRCPNCKSRRIGYVQNASIADDTNMCQDCGHHFTPDTSEGIA